MQLKADLVTFVKEKLGIPLVGIAPPDNFPDEHVARATPVLELFARSTPLAEGSDFVLHPRDFLPEARSVIVTGIPAYLGVAAGFEECRENLLGRAEPSHVNIPFMLHSQEKGTRLTEFLAARGHQCFPAAGTQFPIKLAASMCGVGCYGKNAVIQHPDYGSWISLMAYITDAELAPDEALESQCGTCEQCLKACPTGALFEPYRCDAARCIDFNLGHNKKDISMDIRDSSGNLLGEGCTMCRDACPKNKNLTPLQGFESDRHLLHPALLDVFSMSDEEWEEGFAMTLMGFFLMDKKYLQRNAAIGLGNFRDTRAVPVLAQVLSRGDEAVRGYAAWALGKIGGPEVLTLLSAAMAKEKLQSVRDEIQSAISRAS